jgi:hypothetical protein
MGQEKAFLKLSPYVPKFKIHEPTGVLQVYLDNGRNNTLTGEPNHILVREEIVGDRETRKRGIWNYVDPEDAKRRAPFGYRDIYFTCPWCGAIGKSTLLTTLPQHADSVCCGSIYDKGKLVRTIGCNRHLTLSYREPGKEKEDHAL